MPQTPYPRIGRYLVDLDALQRITHRYDPVRCAAQGCCCASYEISLGRAEVDRIAGCLPHAAAFAPWLLDRGKLTNPFDEETPSRYVLDTDDDGRCVFAYTNGAGETRCSIHSAALQLGLPPFQTKPRSCALWPLAVSEGRPPLLSIQPDAFDFPCNRRRRPRADRSLDPSIAELIQLNFGPAFLPKILVALAAHQ